MNSKYKVVNFNNLNELHTEVNDKLMRWWECIWWLCVERIDNSSFWNTLFYQAMIFKFKVIDEKEGYIIFLNEYEQPVFKCKKCNTISNDEESIKSKYCINCWEFHMLNE